MSESSAPNLALLVAEASPAKDTGANNTDQLAHMHAHHTSDAKGCPAKPADDQSRASSVPRVMPQANYPGHPPAITPAAAGQSPALNSSPAGRYSPAPLTAGMVSPASGQQGLPGGAVAAHAQAGNMPAVGMASPSGYSGTRPMPGMAQRAGTAAPSAQRTPPRQPQQQQHQALSCPPMPGAGMGSPYGAGAGAGPAPHSAGQLGAAGMPAQHRPGAGMPSLSMSPTPPGAGGWVTTSRGSGTPLPFGSAGPMPPQQQGFPSPMQLSPGGYPAGLCTPGTASTAQTAGSLTHVHSVHSTAGSCGGSVPPSSTTPGSTTPKSASSATSGGQGSSAGSRSPADRSRLAALAAKNQTLFRSLEQLEAASAQVCAGRMELLRTSQIDRQQDACAALSTGSRGKYRTVASPFTIHALFLFIHSLQTPLLSEPLCCCFCSAPQKAEVAKKRAEAALKQQQSAQSSPAAAAAAGFHSSRQSPV
jgi:hypothetical protein